MDKRDAIRSYAVALGICRVDLSGAWTVGFSGHEDQSHRDVVDRSEWSTPENSGAEGARQVWTGDLLCSWASEVVALIADSELYQVFFLFYSGKYVFENSTSWSHGWWLGVVRVPSSDDLFIESCCGFRRHQLITGCPCCGVVCPTYGSWSPCG